MGPNLAVSGRLPGSEKRLQLVDERETQMAVATHPEFAKVLLARLKGEVPERGLSEPEAFLEPVKPEESQRLTGLPFPDSLKRKLELCREATPQELLERRLLTSAETLARVLPQLVGEVRALDLPDESSRRLYTRLYEAFRNRRSLLLFYLQHQVTTEEVPWIACWERLRNPTDTSRTQARKALGEVVGLALKHFPYTILPNKLLGELRSLSEAAGQPLKLVDEVAADIFMGSFSEKYARAAQQAGHLLQGSLYERYYAIDYRALLTFDEIEARYGVPTVPAFDALCYQRAGQRPGWGSVAANGTVIEQEQILTTHNLATLFQALDLSGLDLAALARQCWHWVAKKTHQPDLATLKNQAYAWRQMVFFLSLCQPKPVEEFLAWAAEVDCPFLTPHRENLQRAWEGEPVATPFLGWRTTSFLVSLRPLE